MSDLRTDPASRRTLNQRFRPANKRFKGSALLLLVAAAMLLAGCMVKVPMAPHVRDLELKQSLPLEAALLVPSNVRGYVFRGNPESYTGSARPHEFPLGEALEKASLSAFKQVFKQVDIVRSRAEADNYEVTIEPQIQEFHFEYDALSYAGFAVAVISRITIRVTLATGKVVVFEKTVASPPQKRGPWFIDTEYEIQTGQSASDAMAFSLETIAKEISEDPWVRASQKDTQLRSTAR